MTNIALKITTRFQVDFTDKHDSIDTLRGMKLTRQTYYSEELIQVRE